MEKQGVIVGCDRNQEWLLPWWWEHYSACNSYPVVFMDFEMSKQALDWCRDRGQCLKPPLPNVASESDISSFKKERWEARYGKGIWLSRSAWFKKPLALLHSPFSVGLWLDLDCQVNGLLEPFFNCLSFGAEIALVKEPTFIQDFERQQGFLLPEEIHYNSGVIAFQQDAPILHQWVKEALDNNQSYVGDQQALCRTIFSRQPHLIELPLSYNWPRILGPNPQALIYHYTGGAGKLEIMQQTGLIP